MKPGTIIRLPDKRIGTVVYHGLDGYGIKWGKLVLNEEDVEQILSGDGNCIKPGMPEGFTFEPDAMLRDTYPHAIEEGIECVGEDFKVLNYGSYMEVTMSDMNMPIPERTKASLRRYADERIPTGGFLRAVLSNNLVGSFSQADDENKEAMSSIVMYVYNEIPGNCWGSPEIVDEWLTEAVQ